MKKIITSSIIIILAVVIISSFVNTPSVQGSVNIGNGYAYKTITTSNASSTAPTVVTVRGGSGILGSIVVASSSNTAISIYNNTTATSSGTLIATLPANATAGTYTFDVNVTNGISINMPQTFTGVYTITYR